MKRITLSLFILLTFVSGAAFAQQTNEPLPGKKRPAFGAFGDLNVNMAHANFSQLPGIPDCNALYQTGTGIGPSLGVFYELPIHDQFSLLLRGGYSAYGEKIASNESAPIAIDGLETSAMIEHSITASLGMIGIQPMVNYYLLPSLAIHIGAEFGFVINSSFSQIETLTQPANSGVFDNGLRTRNPQSGKIPNANSIVASLVGGLSYQFPLNTANSLQLVPELSYSIGLTPVVKNLNWSVNVFRAGASIRYEIPEKPIEKPIEKPLPVPIDTTPPPEPVPVASVTAAGVEANGEESPVANMRIEEIYSVQMKPLLPYIFFEKNDHILPSRYVKISSASASNFHEILIKDEDALAINHQTLNVIGRRLTDNREATITLAGITLHGLIDNKLALRRADEVAEYLKSIWHISPDRIRTNTHALANEAGPLDSDGIVEANRVEIASNAFDILEPVMGSDTIRNVTPPIIRFRPSCENIKTIGHWKLDASQNGKILKTFEGTSPLPEKLDWVLAEDESRKPSPPGKLEYRLLITNSHGNDVTANGILPVEQISLKKKKIQRMADREIEKYNLLLFDLESSEINQTNKQILELIQQHLKDISTITIVGHTDRSGEIESNKRLSFERAKNTARALGVPNAEIRGIANETILYDNSLPEGRCLSRTVDIIIETPTDSQ